MEQGRFGSQFVPSELTNGSASRSSSSFSRPDYSSKAVQDALQRLATIDLLNLCNEAKIEHCRATRDLRSCGRPVECVLVSCGHASLCAECSQRSDICPICRTPLAKNANRIQPGLYYQCVEAGLIPRLSDGRPQEEDDEEAQMTADVKRLYSFFDVALGNNLCCLICQYVTDVCMDDNAVSSDPVIAFLLDEIVVKDWCKRTFRSIVVQLRQTWEEKGLEDEVCIEGDCIGSAFNSRGAMQCPNCRNTEKGRWLYGSGVPVFDDSPDEEFYDLSYSETSLGVRWCPFMLSQLSSHFEDGEFSSSAYHDLLGHQALLSEHASVSSTNQPSPYFSYYGPIHSSSPSTRPSIPDNLYNNHWSTSLSGLNEAPTSFSFLSMDPHFRAWEHHRLANLDQFITQRFGRSNSSMARPGFVVHPFLAGHSSSTRASNNIPSAMIPPYPGSGARTRDHIQAIQAQFQQPNSSPPGRSPLLSASRHSSNHRSSSQLASSSDPTGGYYIFPPNAHNGVFQEADRSLDGWERETEWGLIGDGTNSLRNGSSQAPSQAIWLKSGNWASLILPLQRFQISLAFCNEEHSSVC